MDLICSSIKVWNQRNLISPNNQDHGTFQLGEESVPLSDRARVSLCSRRSWRHFCGHGSVRLHFVFPLVCCLYTTAPPAGSSAHRGRGGGGVKLLIKVLKVWEFMCLEPGRWCHLSCSASFIHLNPAITHTLGICSCTYAGYLHYSLKRRLSEGSRTLA